MIEIVIRFLYFFFGFLLGALVAALFAAAGRRGLEDRIDIMRIANKKQEEEKDAIIKGFVEKEKERK